MVALRPSAGNERPRLFCLCAIFILLLLVALAIGLILGLASHDMLDRLPTSVSTGTVNFQDSSKNNGVTIDPVLHRHHPHQQRSHNRSRTAPSYTLRYVRISTIS